MITLHRLNGTKFILNAEQIRFIESTPDTVITLAGDGDRIMVKEPVDEVVRLVIEYKRQWMYMPQSLKQG